jgi:hypothetical protein
VAQLNWTYYSLTGRPYALDMYHGEESGHLIFFVNSNVIMIEFGQKESRNFSFFIENQLIEFKIKKENSNYEYVVTPQKPPDVDVEEKLFSKHFWIPLILLIIALNLLVIFYIQ